MKDVTIICCYNNLNQYKKFLDSLSGQSMEVELIGIDNSKKAFQSCAAAFNTNICNVETPYIIFSHQDIEFVDENNILDFVNSIKKVALYDIVGVAGRLVQGGTVVSNIVQGEAKQYAGKQRLSNITECDVIDECFFGGYTENFKQYPFDEDLCNNWHLYAVDRCLDTKARGNHVYICPITLLHKSKGKMNHIYNKQFYLLSKKYSKSIAYINTTCAYASTRFPHREIAYIRRAISLFLGRY